MIRRTAFSLVEVLVGFSIGSTVLALSVGMIHQAIRVAETAKANNQRSLHSNRFFEQFRNDVHLGVDVEFNSDRSLTIELQDHSKIVYAIEKNHVTREQTVLKDKMSRDAMTLAENNYGTLHFDETTKTASLCIFLKLELHHAPPRLNRCVEAILARAASSYTIVEEGP